VAFLFPKQRQQSYHLPDRECALSGDDD
jgi:hypothetical protein